jgi:hypothetical protein
MRVGWKGDRSVWKVPAVALIMTSGVDMCEEPRSYYAASVGDLRNAICRGFGCFRRLDQLSVA